MIRFDCMGYKGIIDEHGFMRWNGMGFFLDGIHPEKALYDAIADALLNSRIIDKIIMNWFDLSFGYEHHDQ